MRIYTRTGDEGQTGIIGGRVDKDDVRVEAYGTIDELNSFIGLAESGLTEGLCADMKADLLEIQHELFDCGSDLSRVAAGPEGYKLTADSVARLEQWIDRYDADTPELTRFILPGGSPSAAQLHICRTVCRRAERRVVTLAKECEINGEVRKYLNRLSDLLFTMARTANVRESRQDIEYIRSAEVFRKPL